MNLRIRTLALALFASMAVVPASASAITLINPVPDAHVKSGVSFAWQLSPGAFYGGVNISGPSSTVDSPCCTTTETSFTPSEPLEAGTYSWYGQEEVPGAEEGSSVVQQSAPQSFIVDPSLTMSSIRVTWRGNTTLNPTPGMVNGARMTLTRSFTNGNLPTAYEVTTVRNARNVLVYQARGYGAIFGTKPLSPLTRTGTFALPTLPAGRYKVTTQIREKGSTGTIRASRSTTLVVRSRAIGYGKKIHNAVCGIDAIGSCAIVGGH